MPPEPPPELSPTGAALLGLLALRPWTTYELATQAKRSLRWFWPRAERKLYAEPKQLVAKGYATSEKRATGHRQSTVYTITVEGRRALGRWLAEAGEAPSFESEDLVRVFFSDSGTPEQLLATVERMRARAVALLSELAEIGATPNGVDQIITERASVNALSFALVFGVYRSIADWGAWARSVLTAQPDAPSAATAPATVFDRAVDLARRYGGDPRTGEATASARPPTLLVVVAHPDDETFGCGSLLLDAKRAGARTIVCCASRGEAGEDATGQTTNSLDLARRREAELREAATVLGVDQVEILGFADSGWDGEPPSGSLVGVAAPVLTAAIEEQLLRHRPDVVVTLDPTGSDGHRDHAAVGQATTSAFQRVVAWGATLYHWCLPRSLMTRWRAHTAGVDPDSVYLEAELGRLDEGLTTHLHYPDLIEARRAAIAAHRTQASPFDGLSAELEAAFLGADHLVRIVPPWTGGATEAHLLGLRTPADPASEETLAGSPEGIQSGR